eukprot:TRINITY_DN7662_c0_g2_i1.p1 TRINITY_DN7662_c0_g2~~TRINITY_DN7662_c0_g2_i1.p1  ORF type:complete len:223 (+),score=18.35 TRINITY_DN7662_c0_g2_i1:3-671(+)
MESTVASNTIRISKQPEPALDQLLKLPKGIRPLQHFPFDIFCSKSSQRKQRKSHHRNPTAVFSRNEMFAIDKLEIDCGKLRQAKKSPRFPPIVPRMPSEYFLRRLNNAGQICDLKGVAASKWRSEINLLGTERTVASDRKHLRRNNSQTKFRSIFIVKRRRNMQSVRLEQCGTKCAMNRVKSIKVFESIKLYLRPKEEINKVQANAVDVFNVTFGNYKAAHV